MIKQIIKLSLISTLILHLNANEITYQIDPTEQLDPTKEEHTLFMKKYSNKINSNIRFETNENITAKDININDIIKQKNKANDFSELNAKSLTDIVELKKDIYNDAINYTKDTMLNDNMLDNIKKIQQNILYDKEWSFAGKKYMQDILDYNPAKLNIANTEKEYLKKDEVIYVVISKSIPENTIINYFHSLNDNKKDVQFILRGIVGNDLSKLMPTLNYLKSLMDKVKEENYYNISINPKIIQALKIDRVPAIIFLQNYNYELENPDNISSLNNDVKSYIFYGDAPLAYALEKINIKAKSVSLQQLINNLNKSSFYNYQEKE